jgi:hypothetical protein
MAWNRAMSHLGVPLAMFDKSALLYLILSKEGVSVVVVGIMVVGATLAALLIGHLDIKYGLYKKENSMFNQHNLELMEAANRGKKL